MAPHITQQGLPFSLSSERASFKAPSQPLFLDHFWTQLCHLDANMG